MRWKERVLCLAAGVVYAFFAASCFRLAVVNDDEVRVSVGEGMFTLIGAAAFFAAAARSRRRAAIVFVGTVPLVGWFLATPWNSGPPFLVASLIAPAIAVAVFFHQMRRRTQWA
jgi:hypothetical protein